MKKLLLISALLFSCENEDPLSAEKFCWKCTFTVSAQGYSGTGSQTLCDMTREQMEVAKNKGIREASVGGMVASGNCVKQQ